MIIISIDPQVEKSAAAFGFISGGEIKLSAVGTFRTNRMIENPMLCVLGYVSAWPIGWNRIAIIEGQYVGANKKGSLALCAAANRMAGALIANGFEVFTAPVWSKKKVPGIPQQLSWMEEHLGYRHAQTRAENKRISMQLAKQIWPGVASEDEADAINILQWWWPRNKHRYKEVE